MCHILALSWSTFAVRNKNDCKMKTNSNTPMSTTDKIVAQLESNGRVIARVSTSNITSIDEIIGMVRALAGRFMGLARLTIRNQTQGWSHVVALASRRCAAPAYCRPTSLPAMQGRQYLIPF